MMAKKKDQKKPNKRAEKYEDKLSIDGTLDDVLRVSVDQSEEDSDSKKTK